MEKSGKPHYLRHRLRLRERFAKTHGKGLQDYEMLELLLTYAIPRRDVKPTSKALLKRFGSLSGVLDATVDDLLQCEGIGQASAMLIRLVKELFIAYSAEHMAKKKQLTTPKEVVDFARLVLSDYSNEAFLVVYLNVKNEVIDHELMSVGTIDRVAVYPRRIVEAALQKKASSIILVHNHPTGHVTPSKEDIRLTKAIMDATGLLDIRVLDHIVVGKKNYLSFLERNLMPEQ